MTEKRSYTNDNAAIPERRIFHYMIILAIVTTALSAVIMLTDIRQFPKLTSRLEPAKLQVLPAAIKPPSPPLDILPDFVLQYAVRGRQTIPGTQYPSAEAIYEILDSNIALATPVNTYARVTYFPTASQAQKDIDETLKSRYPKRNKNVAVQGVIVKTGYDQHEGGYFMGWTKGNYSIKISTAFLDNVPVEKKNTLEQHAMPVAKAIVLGPDANKKPSKLEGTGTQGVKLEGVGERKIAPKVGKPK